MSPAICCLSSSLSDTRNCISLASVPQIALNLNIASTLASAHSLLSPHSMLSAHSMSSSQSAHSLHPLLNEQLFAISIAPCPRVAPVLICSPSLKQLTGGRLPAKLRTLSSSALLQHRDINSNAYMLIFA